MRVWLILFVAVTAALCGAALTVLITQGDDGSGSPDAVQATATSAATTEPTITRQQLKLCLDSYGANAQPENFLVGNPDLDELIAQAAGGEGGMTAFDADSSYAAANADDLIGTGQPEFVFMASAAEASEAAASSDIVVTQQANVVVASPGGEIAPKVEEIINTCLADLA